MTGTRRKVNRHGINPESVDMIVALPSDNSGWIALKRAFPERWPESHYVGTNRFCDGWGNPNDGRIRSSTCTREDFMWCITCKLKGAWLNHTVLGLLARIPDDLSVLPILADALESAGCYEETILSVLRSS